MQRVELRKLAASKEEYADKQLTVAGWVRTIRTSKNLGFIELNDGTCFQNLQVVFENSKVENFNEISKLNVPCYHSGYGKATTHRGRQG